VKLGAVLNSLPFLLTGLQVTLLLSVASLTLGLFLGFLFGILAVTGTRPVKVAIAAYVFVIRGIPLLVLIFFIFFALPFWHVYIPEMAAAILSLAIYASALITEIVRGSIESIPRGQIEAAKALGMRGWSIVREVVLPQAMRYTLPPLTSTFAMLIKSTALVSLLGVGELLRSGREVMSRSLASFELMTAVLIIYFIVIYPLSRLSVMLEKRFSYVH
jgi:His/Glu/Gln/Arg/opine family amino acid ABC transporter permease subunit